MANAAKPRSPFALEPTERAPLSIAVSRQLREAIVSGRVSIGTELPSEKELARDLGVGRSTVREALRILQAQGLLSGGDTVSTARPRVSSDQTLSMAASTMENALRLGQVPLGDLVELRVLLESAAVRDAAERGEPSLDEAQEALAIMKAPRVDIEAFRAADLRFHAALAAASGNVAFGLVMGVLRTAISSHLGEALLRVPNARTTMAALTREHEQILAAVVAGRAKRAAELVTDHIRAFYEAEQKP
jgi:GntR family transcriptional regulator, transcriptional repressor for pyruvate dehydrogenase complex